MHNTNGYFSSRSDNMYNINLSLKVDSWLNHLITYGSIIDHLRTQRRKSILFEMSFIH